jgi:DNA mismatch repair protein MutL
MTGRYPIAVLSLHMPSEMVDVNVHPTKLEVRFQDSGRLYSQLLSTLRSKFLSTDLTTRVETPRDEDNLGLHDTQQTERLHRQVVDWARGAVDSGQGGKARSDEAGPRPFEGPAATPGQRSLEPAGFDRQFRPSGDASFDRRPESQGRFPEGPSGQPAWDGQSTEKRGKALQVHNRYLVAESQDGVMVIDQHALHERILYEQLRKRIEAGPIESQTLLVPEPVDLSPQESAAALENRDVLAKLGVEIQPFGGDTLLVSSYPAMLANMSPVDVLHGLLEPLMAGGKEPDRRDLLDEMLHMIACKAAIKAGDRLAPEEISALLEQRHLIDDPHHCPHGRPTAVIFSTEELDRQFKRT